MKFNPCDPETIAEYQNELLESGVAIGPFRRGLGLAIHQKLTEGAAGAGPPYSGNLVVATSETVGNLAQAGFAPVGRADSMFLLPPELKALEEVRDALYVEGLADFFTTRTDPVSELARNLVKDLEAKASRRFLALGPRSTLCHQNQLVARAGFFHVDTGRDVHDLGEALHEKCKRGFVNLRIQVPEKKWVRIASPSFVSANVCLSCWVADVSLHLGLARTKPLVTPPGWERRHRHAWRKFRLPVADLSAEHRFGFVTGEVCVSPVTTTSRSTETVETCRESRGVKLAVVEGSTFNLPGFQSAQPELRLRAPASHVHVWAVFHDPAKVDSKVFCVTCDAVLARAASQVAAGRKARAANPLAWLPRLGEDDETPDLLAQRKDA